MTAINWRLAALALLLGLAVGGWCAWVWQANDYGEQLAAERAEHAQEASAAATAALDKIEQHQAARAAMEARMRESDITHTQEMTNAQKDQARLRDRLATADLRLSVLLANPGAGAGGGGGVPTAAGAGGVVHGATRGELDPAHAQRIVGITDDGDDGLTALKGCQGYIRALFEGGG